MWSRASVAAWATAPSPYKTGARSESAQSQCRVATSASGPVAARSAHHPSGRPGIKSTLRARRDDRRPYAGMRLALAALAATAVLIGGVPRVLLAAGTLPEVLRPFTWSDPLFTYVRGLSGHRLPYFDTPYEYPPLLGFGAGLFSWLAPNAVMYVALWTVALAFCAAVTAYLLAPFATRSRIAAAWALAPQLVIFGTLNF